MNVLVQVLLSVLVGMVLGVAAANAHEFNRRLNPNVSVPLAYALSVIIAGAGGLSVFVTFLALSAALVYFKDRATYIERVSHVVILFVGLAALIGYASGSSITASEMVTAYLLGVVAGVVLPFIIAAGLLLPYVAFHPLLLLLDVVSALVGLLLLILVYGLAPEISSGLLLLVVLFGLVMGVGHFFTNIVSFLIVKPARKVSSKLRGRKKE